VIRLLGAASLITATFAAGCATLPPAPPSRTPTPIEKEEARRTGVLPYLSCMQIEARKLGDGGLAVPSAVDASELKCGRLIQALRRYGAAKDYDALMWSDYVGQVERNGRSIAAESAAAGRKRD
jgi:hypothetical protein